MIPLLRMFSMSYQLQPTRLITTGEDKVYMNLIRIIRSARIKSRLIGRMQAIPVAPAISSQAITIWSDSWKKIATTSPIPPALISKQIPTWWPATKCFYLTTMMNTGQWQCTRICKMPSARGKARHFSMQIAFIGKFVIIIPPPVLPIEWLRVTRMWHWTQWVKRIHRLPRPSGGIVPSICLRTLCWEKCMTPSLVGGRLFRGWLPMPIIGFITVLVSTTAIRYPVLLDMNTIEFGIMG